MSEFDDVTKYPIPESDWSLESYSNPSKIVRKHLSVSSMTIVDESEIINLIDDKHQELLIQVKD